MDTFTEPANLRLFISASHILWLIAQVTAFLLFPPSPLYTWDDTGHASVVSSAKLLMREVTGELVSVN